MRRPILRIHHITLQIKQQIPHKPLLMLRVRKHHRHALARTPHEIRRHHQRHIRRRHLGRRRRPVVQKQLQEAHDKHHHASVVAWETRDELDGADGVVGCTGADAFVVHLVGDEWGLEFAQPEFEEGGGDVGVFDAVERVETAVDAELEGSDGVTVTGDTEDAFCAGAAEGEDGVGEEGEDDGDLLVWVCARLETHDGVERFAECRGIERGVL